MFGAGRFEVIKAAGFVLQQTDVESSSEEEKFLVSTEQERIATNVKSWTDLWKRHRGWCRKKVLLRHLNLVEGGEPLRHRSDGNVFY